MANVDKIRSVVAYLAEKTRPGKVKLFKLMYFADFTAKAELGQAITGDTYENFEMGPVPQTLWNRFAEITASCVTVHPVQTGVIPEQQMRRRPEFMPQLSADEIKVLDKVVVDYGHMTGSQLKDLTHKTLPYKATRRGDTVPYGMAGYLHYERPSQAQLDAALASPDTAARLTASAARRAAKQATLT